MVLVYCALFGVVPSFVVISLEKRELVALLKYHFSLNLTVSVLCLFLKVRWLGLKCGISWSYSLFHVILLSSILKNPHCKYHQQGSAVG